MTTEDLLALAPFIVLSPRCFNCGAVSDCLLPESQGNCGANADGARSGFCRTSNGFLRAVNAI